MIQTLMMLVPPEAFLPLLVLAGFLIMVGLRRIGLTLMSTVLFLALFGPVIDGILEMLPDWLLLLLLVGFLLGLVRMLLGPGVADNLTARLLYDLILAPFRFLGWLLRGFRPRQRS